MLNPFAAMNGLEVSMFFFGISATLMALFCKEIAYVMSKITSRRIFDTSVLMIIAAGTICICEKINLRFVSADMDFVESVFFNMNQLDIIMLLIFSAGLLSAFSSFFIAPKYWREFKKEEPNFAKDGRRASLAVLILSCSYFALISNVGLFYVM